MFRFHRRRHVGAHYIARRLGVSAEMFLRLYEQPLWRVPNGHRVAPYTVGWSLLELLRPRR